MTKDSATRLIREIKALRKQSSDPITIVINSRGGQVEAFLLLEALFSDDKHCPAIKIITRAHHAISAAACLLVVGHRAYVKKNVKLLFHGARVEPARPPRVLRREDALALAMQLDRQNRIVAKVMARQVAIRMTARYLALSPAGANKFAPQNPWVFYKKFADHIRPRLSSKRVVRVLYESLERLKLILALARLYTKKVPSKGKSLARLEVQLYKAAIDFEARANRSRQWALGPAAAAELMIDYLLARDQLGGKYLAAVNDLARKVGPHFCSPAELRKYSQLKNASPAKAEAYLLRATLPCLLGFWHFAATLCHRLLYGENTLTASDAYWLGFVDGISGRKKSAPPAS